MNTGPGGKGSFWAEPLLRWIKHEQVDLHMILKTANEARKKGYLDKSPQEQGLKNPDDIKAFELAAFIRDNFLTSEVIVQLDNEKELQRQ